MIAYVSSFRKGISTVSDDRVQSPNPGTEDALKLINSDTDNLNLVIGPERMGQPKEGIHERRNCFLLSFPFPRQGQIQEENIRVQTCDLCFEARTMICYSNVSDQIDDNQEEETCNQLPVLISDSVSSSEKE
jgi:hypothetical protein